MHYLSKYLTSRSRLLKKPLTIKSQRLFLWCVTSCIFNFCHVSHTNAKEYSIIPEGIGSHFMEIDILNSFLIKSKSQKSIPLIEISDLAWDEDQQLLYAVSDEGYLYHFKLDIENKNLKSIDLVFATQLKDKNHKPLKGKFLDSEGLTIRNSNNNKPNDSQLIISFENDPRIASYFSNGDFDRKIKLPKTLRKKKSYRGNNKALEGVAFHNQYGIITAPELPLKKDTLEKQTLFSTSGKKWNFKATGTKNSSITALEVLPNKNILILERAYNGLLSPIVITLRELNINECSDKEFCDTKTLARLDSSEGWRVDNFEGLTHIKDNLYLMISDNNKNPLQKTILILFEIVKNK